MNEKRRAFSKEGHRNRSEYEYGDYEGSSLAALGEHDSSSTYNVKLIIFRQSLGELVQFRALHTDIYFTSTHLSAAELCPEQRDSNLARRVGLHRWGDVAVQIGEQRRV
jgi:hypothetical protein